MRTKIDLHNLSSDLFTSMYKEMRSRYSYDDYEPSELCEILFDVMHYLYYDEVRESAYKSGFYGKFIKDTEEKI